MGNSHIHSLSQKSLVQVETVCESTSRIAHGYDAGFLGPAIPAIDRGNHLRWLLERAANCDVTTINFNTLAHGFLLQSCGFELSTNSVYMPAEFPVNTERSQMQDYSSCMTTGQPDLLRVVHGFTSIHC
jgi:hypothetical protein